MVTIGQVIEYRPRVTGGVITGVVTAVHNLPLFPASVTFRITDGNRLYRTGTTETVFEEDVHEPTP